MASLDLIDAEKRQNNNHQVATKYFLMCKSCYWCASYSTKSGRHIPMCPLCGSNRLACSSI